MKVGANIILASAAKNFIEQLSEKPATQPKILSPQNLFGQHVSYTQNKPFGINQNQGIQFINKPIHQLSDMTTQKILNIMGNEITAHEVFFNNRFIDYQFQFWKIKDASVCSKDKNDLNQYSICTKQAKNLFRHYCNRFSQMDSGKHWKIRSLNNMYCSASRSYSPTIASVREASFKNKASKLDKLKEKCEYFIVRAMSIDSTPEEERKRDLACDKYHAARGY